MIGPRSRSLRAPGPALLRGATGTLLLAAYLALGCADGGDHAGAAEPAPVPADGAGSEDPGDAAVESPDPGSVRGDGAAADSDGAGPPATVEELAARLDEIPEGMEPGFHPEARQEGDPADWTPIRTIGSEAVETIREYDPNSGLLLRIATTRPRDQTTADAPQLHGPEWRYHETGSQRSLQWWRDDVPHGPVRQWRRVGVLAREGRFHRGQRDGLWRQYSKTGRLIEQSIYVRGALVGARQSWFPSGTPEYTEHYVDGKLSGRRRVWDRDGILVLDENYQDGELHGRWSDFHPRDGDPREWGTYERGLRVGRWQRGSPEGVVLGSVLYEEGVLQGEAR
ncbi:MAG: hypothetical protein AAGB93_16390, partial [Planctomycetota bacterium]